MTKKAMAEHVRAIQRAVEAQLPEDEPDCVRPWVYETAVRVMLERLADAPAQETTTVTINERLKRIAAQAEHGYCWPVRGCPICEGREVVPSTAPAQETTPKPCAYEVLAPDMLGPSPLRMGVRIEQVRGRVGSRDIVRWGIFHGSNQHNAQSMSRDGEWEWQPLPSERDDAFFASFRFDTFDEALACWTRHRPAPPAVPSPAPGAGEP